MDVNCYMYRLILIIFLKSKRHSDSFNRFFMKVNRCTIQCMQHAYVLKQCMQHAYVLK